MLRRFSRIRTCGLTARRLNHARFDGQKREDDGIPVHPSPSGPDAVKRLLAIIALLLPANTAMAWPSWFAPQTPHPAVVRVVARDADGFSMGSGSLVAVSPSSGLVVTNWHVVRDAVGPITVHFPDGFRSGAVLLRVDRDWDLAALAIAPAQRGADPAVGRSTAARRSADHRRLRPGLLPSGHWPMHGVFVAWGKFAQRNGRTGYRGPAGRLGRSHPQLARRDRRRALRNRFRPDHGQLLRAGSGLSGVRVGRFPAGVGELGHGCRGGPTRLHPANTPGQRSGRSTRPIGWRQPGDRFAPAAEHRCLIVAADHPDLAPSGMPAKLDGLRDPAARLALRSIPPCLPGPSRSRTILAAIGVLSILLHSVRLIGAAAG